MSKSERKKHSRDEIRVMAVDAAKSLIVQQGLAQVSARKIATAIGYAPGTLYLVFKNLDELIMYINMQTAEQCTVLMRSALQQLGDKADKKQRLTAVCDAYIDYAMNHTALYRAWFAHRLAADSTLCEHYQQAYAAMIQVLEDALKEKQIGLFTVSYQAEAQLLATALYGACEQALDEKTMLSAEQVKVSIDLLVRYAVGL